MVSFSALKFLAVPVDLAIPELLDVAAPHLASVDLGGEWLVDDRLSRISREIWCR